MKISFFRRRNQGSVHRGRQGSAPVRSRRLRLESLEERALLAADSVISFSPMDVNRDGGVTPIDALLIISDLNKYGARAVGGGSGSASTLNISASDGSGARALNQAAADPLDVNIDGMITPLDALMVIHELNQQAGDEVRIRLQVTDTGGNPITSIVQGQNFVLQAFVQDVRVGATDPGVGAAYADVTFDSSLATPSGSIVHGADYPNAPGGDTTTAGVINEAGGLQSAPGPLGANERLLFSVQMLASAAGVVTFTADQADILPQHATLVFEPPSAVPPANIDYGSVSLTISGLPTISIADAQVVEGNAGASTMQFNLTLSAPSDDPVTVHYATAAGTATADVDYQSQSGTVTFQPRQTTAQIAVTVNGDTLNEANETFFVNLDTPTAATIADGQATGTIQNDDPVPGVSIADASVLEGTGASTTTMTFNVALSAPSGQIVTVQFQTAPGTATAGTDYQSNTGTVTFQPGETSKPVTVDIVADALNETDETLLVNLSSPSNATITDGQATGTIQDDDPQPTMSISDATLTEPPSGSENMTFTVSLSAASGQTVTVDFATAPQDATADVDYATTSGTVTFAAGETAKTITVPINADGDAEADEKFAVNLSAPSRATIADGQGIGTIVDFAVDKEVRIRLVATDLDGNPISTVTGGDTFLLKAFVKDVREEPDGVFAAYADVTFDPSLITVIGPIAYGADYPNIHSGTINSGELDEIGATGDVAFLGAPERLLFSVPVQGIGGGIASFALNPADLVAHNEHAVLVYGAGVVPVAGIQFLDSGPITITPPPTLSVDSPSITEGDSGNKNLTFTVTLDQQVDETVTVQFATIAGTATEGVDYLPQTGTVTFNPQQTTQTITIPIVGDALNEPDETFTVKLSNPTNAVVAFGADSGTGTILNDDPVPTISVGDTTAIEGVTNAVFTVNLSAPSGRTVTVNYTTAAQTASADVDYTSQTGTITFLPGETSKLVSIDVPLDNVQEGPETFLLQLSAPTNATLANTQAVATINELPASSLAGFVYRDTNENGIREAGEAGLFGVGVRLVGVDMFGRQVNLTTTTAADGSYSFTGLVKGTYVLTEVQPTNRFDGADTIGSQGGTVLADDTFQIELDTGVNGVENNFAELGLSKPFSRKDLV
ncbi:MAG: hypothetical protein HYX69_17455 [Planctomycetia bacterium]|nr:hypothetical protein [Planctomycetia bacterium]